MPPKYVAYITKYRGTGRPNAPCIRRLPDEYEGNPIEAVDPMAAYDGARNVGVFDTFEEADAALESYWNNMVVEDDHGYTQWRVFDHVGTIMPVLNDEDDGGDRFDNPLTHLDEINRVEPNHMMRDPLMGITDDLMRPADDEDDE